MHRLRNHGGLLFIVATLLLIFSLLPLGTALEFGGDEAYELMKGFLCSKGFSLYTDIWNDQPPVHTMLLSGAFKLFGPSLLAARLIAASFGLLLFGTFYQLVRLRSGIWAAILAVFFLVASPGVLSLSVAVMLEVPAIGTALLAAWLLFQWGKRRHWGWLLASGIVMGIALEIKLTAVVVAPAIIAEIVLLRQAERRPAWQRAAIRDVLRWGATVTAVFFVIGLIWGNGSFQSSLKSHFSERAVPGLSRPNDFRFQPTIFLDHGEGAVGAVIGLLFVVRNKRWREVTFPLILLLTALVIHTLHRPWWPYYYLHLAVPLAWLAGIGAGEVLRGAGQIWSAQKFRLTSAATWKWIGLCALTALALAMAEARLEASIKGLRKSPRANDSPVLAKLMENANRTHWMYAQPIVYPFHAKLPVPPELAVVVLKRFWSGQISTKEIVEVCRRYHPEQLLLFKSRAGSEWRQLLSTDYVLTYQDKDYLLYVAKGIEDK